MEFNGLDPIGTEESPRNPFRKHRLRRGIYILPSIFTVANLLCGYYAVLATLAYRVASYWVPLLAGPPAYLLFRHRYGRSETNMPDSGKTTSSPE